MVSNLQGLPVGVLNGSEHWAEFAAEEGEGTHHHRVLPEEVAHQGVLGGAWVSGFKIV